ncbi:MAG: hypothetical protein AAGC55_33865, partial [Myxococcota bacterium]
MRDSQVFMSFRSVCILRPIASLIAAANISVSYAATVTWDGSTDNQWATASNWTPSGEPTENDDVEFDYTAGSPIGTIVLAPSQRLTRSVSILFSTSGTMTLGTNSATDAISIESGELFEVKVSTGTIDYTVNVDSKILCDQDTIFDIQKPSGGTGLVHLMGEIANINSGFSKEGEGELRISGEQGDYSSVITVDEGLLNSYADWGRNSEFHLEDGTTLEINADTVIGKVSV